MNQKQDRLKDISVTTRW